MCDRATAADWPKENSLPAILTNCFARQRNSRQLTTFCESAAEEPSDHGSDWLFPAPERKRLSRASGRLVRWYPLCQIVSVRGFAGALPRSRTSLSRMPVHTVLISGLSKSSTMTCMMNIRGSGGPKSPSSAAPHRTSRHCRTGRMLRAPSQVHLESGHV